MKWFQKQRWAIVVLFAFFPSVSFSAPKVYTSLDEAMKSPESALDLQCADHHALLKEVVAKLPNLKILRVGGGMDCENESRLTPADFALIGQLHQLRSVSLGSSNLKVIPSELFSLVNLEELSLEYNEIAAIDPGIVKLTHLKRLWLGSNNITQLPAELAQLSALEELYLGDNKLTQLPEEIGKLQALKSLDLSNEYEVGGNHFSPAERDKIRKLLPRATIHFPEE